MVEVLVVVAAVVVFGVVVATTTKTIKFTISDITTATTKYI